MQAFPILMIYAFDAWLLVHEELDVNRASPSFPVMLNSFGPSCAFNIDEDTRGWVLQLHHDDGLEVAELVPVGEEVPGEASPANVKPVFVHFG